MKKIFTLVAVLFLIQTGMSQSTLPNGDFESWTYVDILHCYQPDGGFFYTLNPLDTIPTPPGLTAYPCDTAHAGSKSARLITRKIDIMDILIPGVIGTLQINTMTASAILGTPYTWTTKPERFQGYYKSYPVSGDSSGAIVLLSKWNSTTMKRDTIAYTKLVFHGTVDTWTAFDEAIDYWITTEMPDSITLLLLSCAGYNASVMTASVGQVGSQALFDDVTLTNISGIDMLMMPDVNVRLVPNPASDWMTITLNNMIKDGVFEVYNTQGKRIAQFPVNNLSTTIDLNNLKGGMYYYKLTEGAASLNTGSFVVIK